jgi:hypothetical protein
VEAVVTRGEKRGKAEILKRADTLSMASVQHNIRDVLYIEDSDALEKILEREDTE